MFSFSSVKNYHDNLLNGHTSCVEAVSFFLHTIEEYKHLNAFLEVYIEEALQRAAYLDNSIKNGNALGKLHGVVIGLKDVIAYKDHKLSASSKILNDFTSIYNATVTKRLLDEGAIIIGRQNCDEFAMGSSSENSAFGNVLNAIDNSRVPGGSSGGSAVSVQANLCMISLGSDTGGSVRQPADFCGIVGLKPSYGKISRFGLIAYASSFDQIGIFSKTIEDAALVLEVIAGADEFDGTASINPAENIVQSLTENENKKYKIAYFKEALEHPALDAEIANAIYSTIENLKSQGHLVEPVNFELLEYIVPAYYILTTAEASSNLSRYDGIKFGAASNNYKTEITDFYKHTRSAGFGKEVQRRIMLGTFVLSSGYYDAYFTKAQQVRQLLAQKTNSIFHNYDAIISPTVPSPAFKIGEKTNNSIEMFLADIYTVFANLVGVPAISLPMYKHSNGMPFGLQVIMQQNNEQGMVQLSKKIMQLAAK